MATPACSRLPSGAVTAPPRTAVRTFRVSGYLRATPVRPDSPAWMTGGPSSLSSTTARDSTCTRATSSRLWGSLAPVAATDHQAGHVCWLQPAVGPMQSAALGCQMRTGAFMTHPQAIPPCTALKKTSLATLRCDAARLSWHSHYPPNLPHQSCLPQLEGPGSPDAICQGKNTLSGDSTRCTLPLIL